MSKRLLPVFAAVYLLLAIQGCAMTPHSPSASELAATDAIPVAEPELDHYIAWIPKDKAQTATVARALTHTALGNARKQAGDHLCGGTWVSDNKITKVIGPIQAWAPSSDEAGYAAWYYRVSHMPGLKGCTAASDDRVYREMEANMPEWLRVKTARTNTGEQPALKAAVTLPK